MTLVRANMPSFGKRTRLTIEHFEPFIKAFGKNAYGQGKRKDEGEEGRFRKFTREEIRKRGDNLDISWLKDESATASGELGDPEEIAAEIAEKLVLAMQEIEALQKVLRGEAES